MTVKFLSHFCTMQNLQTRNATKDDVQLINSLAQKIWRIHYPQIISNKQIEYMLERMYSPNALLKQMKAEGHCFVLCYADDKPVGYCSYSKQNNRNYFLHKLYIDTTQHHRGIGTWFINTVFDNIKDLDSLRLTVNRKNYQAINFYFKTGFVIEEVKDFDIDNGFWMKDFVMVLKK